MKVPVQWQAFVPVIIVQMVPFLQQWLHEVNNNSLRKRKLLLWCYIFSTGINLEGKSVTTILT